MAARKVPLHRAWTPDKVRQRIRTSLIVNRLTDHVLSGTEMARTQITAALGLLRKTLPDLSATELSGEVARPTVIRAPDVSADSKAWLDQHAPAMVSVDTPKPGDVH